MERKTKILILGTLLAGILIRIVCLPLTYDYDMYHWGIIIQNINSGNGLYELNGYFYTPVWGYIMGFTDLIISNLVPAYEIGNRVTEFLPVEDLTMRHVATVTSIGFDIAMKIPLILGDLLIGYILYMFIKERTDDAHKAAIAFALWFLCPINIYMSSIQGMFDNFSALFLLLSVILAVKKHYFLSGSTLSTAILLKMFPVACIFVFLGLLVARHKDRTELARNIALAAGGILFAAALIYIPNIIDGNIMDTLTVATDRASNSGLSAVEIGSYLALVACPILMIYFGIKMARCKEDVDSRFIDYCTYCMCAMMFVNVSPQYVIAALPLIIIWISERNNTGLLYWALIGTGTMISALCLNNYSLMMGISASWDLISPSTIIDGLRWAEDSLVLGAFIVIGYAMELFALAGLIIHHFNPALKEKCPKIEKLFRRVENIGAGGDTDA